MINFNLESFLEAMRCLRHYWSIFRYQSQKDQTSVLSPDDYNKFIKEFNEKIVPFIKDIIHEDGRLEAITSINKMLILNTTLEHELMALDSDISHARQKRIFLSLSPRKRGSSAERLCGLSAILIAFPSAEEDIRAAVDCYALGHNNASIYHCMMVLERGMPVLAKRLKITVRKARPTWKDMIDDIRRGIDLKRTAVHSPPGGSIPLSRRVAKKQFEFLGLCGEAALEFRFFEHAWRNHIAHARARYDENDAKKVLEHVRAFMELITTDLKLKES